MPGYREKESNFVTVSGDSLKIAMRSRATNPSRGTAEWVLTLSALVRGPTVPQAPVPPHVPARPPAHAACRIDTHTPISSRRAEPAFDAGWTHVIACGAV